MVGLSGYHTVVTVGSCIKTNTATL